VQRYNGATQGMRRIFCSYIHERSTSNLVMFMTSYLDILITL
jgi:hypothetical protein